MSKTKRGIKKAVSLSLAVALVLLLSTPAAAARKTGANLSILKKDGASVEGELIAVKGRTLIIKGEDLGLDISLQFDEMKKLIIRKKSKAAIGAGLGLLGGIGLGAVLVGPSDPGISRLGPMESDYTTVGFSALVGVVLGAVFGANPDEEYWPATMNPIRQDELLKKLKSKSRFPQD